MKGYPDPKPETSWTKLKSWVMANKIFRWTKKIFFILFTVIKVVCGCLKKILSVLFSANTVFCVSVLFTILLILAIATRMFGDMEQGLLLDAWLGIVEAEDSSTKYKTIEALSLALAGTLGIIGVITSYKRAKAMEETAKTQAGLVKTQSQVNKDNTYNKAIERLGDKSTSVRLSGIYALYELSESMPEKFKNIVGLLCAHLRETTQQHIYKLNYPDKPSNEIQSLLKLLTELNAKHQRKKPEVLLDISQSYLNGANLLEANLQQANLSHAQIQKANLSKAQMQGANLSHAQMQDAVLYQVQMQDTILDRAQMQRANLTEAQMQKANLSGAKLQETILCQAQMQKTYLCYAHMQRADLSEAQMQSVQLSSSYMPGAILRKAQMQGAILRQVQMQGVNLSQAQMQATILSDTGMGGANLFKAQMQGANLDGVDLRGADLTFAQMQGTRLREIYMRGAFTNDNELDDWRPLLFRDRVEKRIGEPTDVQNIIWSGERDKGDMDEIEERAKALVRENKISKKYLKYIIEIISPHKGKDPNHQMPEEVKTGVLSKEIADEIFQEYEKAMKSVPRFK